MKKVVRIAAFLFVAFIALTVEVNAASKQTIADGKYFIYSAKNDKYALDVAGGKVAKKSNIQIYKGNQSLAQQWVITYLEDGYYEIASAKDANFVLEIAGGKTTKGTNVQLYRANETDSQKWIIKDAGSGLFTIVSKKSNLALDIKGGKMANKSNIQTWTDNGSIAQKFVLSPVVEADDDNDLFEGFYAITSKLVNNSTEEDDYLKNTLSIDLAGGKVANGTNIQMYSYAGSKNEVWIIKSLKNGFYKIASAKNENYVLDVAGGRKTRGANVQLYKYNGSVSQQFKVVLDYDDETGESYYTFINRGNGLALDVKGGSTKNATNLHMYTANGSDAQRFELNYVEWYEAQDVIYSKTNEYEDDTAEYELYAQLKDKYCQLFTCGYGENDKDDGDDPYDYGVQFEIVSTDGKIKKQVTSKDGEYIYGDLFYYISEELDTSKEYKVRARYYDVTKGKTLYYNYTDYVKITPSQDTIVPEFGVDSEIDKYGTQTITLDAADMHNYDGIEIYYKKGNDSSKYKLLADIKTTKYKFSIPYGNYYRIMARYYKVVNKTKKYSSYSYVYDFDNYVTDTVELKGKLNSGIFTISTNLERVVKNQTIGIEIIGYNRGDWEYKSIAKVEKESQNKLIYKVDLSKNDYEYFYAWVYVKDSDGTMHYSYESSNTLAVNVSEYELGITPEDFDGYALDTPIFRDGKTYVTYVFEYIYDVGGDPREITGLEVADYQNDEYESLGDAKLITIDEDSEHPRQVYSIELEAGRSYNLVIGYYHDNGEDRIYSEPSVDKYVDLLAPHITVTDSGDNYLINSFCDADKYAFEHDYDDIYEVTYFYMDDLNSEPVKIVTNDDFSNDFPNSLSKEQYAGKYIVAHYSYGDSSAPHYNGYYSNPVLLD